MPDAACELVAQSSAVPRGDESRDLVVLIVDPDPVSGAACRAELEPAGYLVVQAADARQAFEHIERRRPDVILVDAALARAGESFARARRLESSPASQNIPVILVAPVDVDLDTLAGLESNFDGCLIKPVRTPELLLRVRSATRLPEQLLVRRDSRALRGEQARMWTVLVDFARQMTRVRDLDSILEQIVISAAQMTCCRRVSLMLPDEPHEHLVIVHALGIEEEVKREVRVPVGDAIAGKAFSSGRLVTDVGSEQEAPATDYSGDHFVSMPIVTSSLKVDHQSVGVLNMTDRFGDRPFEEWELEFIDLLGSIAGTIIDDALWRQARESLLKFEHDLKVARRIQQRTFPDRLPRLPGFQLGAWSEPAEETGGDTYDIVGYGHDSEGGGLRLARDEADRALVLLADATGHGIGPALCVTQVRAMLRMVVRIDPDLSRIMRYMNEQLCADLPRGRFVTAWLGELDTTDHTVRCFSAGQGPVLVYRAAVDDFEHREADTIPLGIIDDLELVMPDPLHLDPGDILAVISDGVFEARDGESQEFRTERVIEVIRAYRGESPARILAALQDALAEFTGGTPASDDRTAVIIKRVAA